MPSEVQPCTTTGISLTQPPVTGSSLFRPDKPHVTLIPQDPPNMTLHVHMYSRSP
jgi:hypothetical protein